MANTQTNAGGTVAVIGEQNHPKASTPLEQLKVPSGNQPSTTRGLSWNAAVEVLHTLVGDSTTRNVLKSALHERQHQLRAQEATVLYPGLQPSIAASCAAIAQQLKSGIEPPPIRLRAQHASYNELHARLTFDTDTDRILSLYRTEARKLGMGFRVEVLDQAPPDSAKSVIMRFELHDRSPPAPPAEAIPALRALVNPGGGALDTANALAIGQGFMGSCYLWAGVVSLWNRTPQLRRELLARVQFTPDDPDFVGSVRRNDGEFGVRRSDYLRHLSDRQIFDSVAASHATTPTTKRVTPPELMMLELAEAEARRVENPSKFTKGLGVEGGYESKFLASMLRGEPRWLASDGSTGLGDGSKAANTVHHGFETTQAKEKLREILARTEAHKESYIVTASSLQKKAGDGDFIGHSGGSIARRHAYAVVGFDSKADQVAIINPWDSEQTIRMPLDEFAKCFSRVEAIKLPQKEPSP